VELRHLRYFLTVAEFLHFGRAAQQLRIAQPSLSHQIAQLESELQTKLFERSKKRVQLTESGVLFLEETRQILEHVDRAALLARTGKGPGAERLRVGFGQWTDLTKLCTAIKRFDESHPAVRLELYGMNVPHQIAALREGRIDVGFVRPPVADPVLNSELLIAEPFVVALPKKHRLAKQKRLELSALKDEPIIMAQRESVPFFYDLTLKLFQDAGFVPNVHDEVDYPSMVLALTAVGIGVSLVPASIRGIQSAGLVFLPLQPSSQILETAVAWRRDGVSPALSAFLKVVRHVASSRRRRSQSTRSGTHGSN
jgi:DNA-binding transcriptional LysR family regulator